MKAKRIFITIITLIMCGTTLCGCQTEKEKQAEKVKDDFIQAVEYMKNDEYSKALDCFDQVTANAVMNDIDEKDDEIDPNEQYELYIRSLYLIGDCSYAMGDTKAYESAYKKALDEDTRSSELQRTMTGTDHLKRAMAYECAGDDGNALKTIEEGLLCEDEDAMQELLYNKIVICERLYHWEDAKSAMQEYDKLFPNDARLDDDRIFLSTR